MYETQENQDAVWVHPKTKLQGSVIWLHGLGADGYDFLPIVSQFQKLQGIRFVFPHAPVRPVTLNAGMSMRAWFDIYGLTPGSKQDEEGIRLSEQKIRQWIEQEQAQGLSSNKIVLAGFSQGGALALYSGLRYPQALAGILGLSTLLPMAETLPQELSAANKKTPIFLSHGTQDTVLPLILGELSRQILEELNYPVLWRTYPMAHTVCDAQIRDIEAWLLERLSG